MLLPLTTLRGITVYRDGSAIVWTSGMAIDSDGAYKSYALPGSSLRGLDSIRNALRDPNDLSSGWVGILTDDDGAPIIQGPNDPAPGYCVSPTALSDKEKLPHDPTRYVPSDYFPYISIPPELKPFGVKLGDACFVEYQRKTQKGIPIERSCVAIVGDISPHQHLGEGSVYLAAQLGIPSSPRNGGIAPRVVKFTVWPGSRSSPAWPRTLESLAEQVSTLQAPHPLVA